MQTFCLNSFSLFFSYFCSKFVTDAIPMVGTDASIEMMKTLISNDDIKGSLADMWLASLAFVHHPTKGMIQHMQVRGQERAM